MVSSETKKKLQTRARKIPIWSLLGFAVAVLGIIIAGAAYGTVFDNLGKYFPSFNWGAFRFFLELLLILVSVVQVVAVITAFFATKYYSPPAFCGACLTTCRRCTGNLSQGIIVTCSFVVLVLTVVLFCFASLLRAAQYVLEYSCGNVENTGNPNNTCLGLEAFGGNNVPCGQDFTDFCSYWTNKVTINSLLAGASFLLLANFILISCAVANFMRYRYNIVDEEIKEALAEKGNDTAGLTATTSKLPDQTHDLENPEPEPHTGEDGASSIEYKGSW